MHAITANRLTCCHGKCSQEATVTVHRVVPSLTRKHVIDGTPIPIDVVLDFCLRHAPEEP